jgi:hypothetical protein
MDMAVEKGIRAVIKMDRYQLTDVSLISLFYKTKKVDDIVERIMAKSGISNYSLIHEIEGLYGWV